MVWNLGEEPLAELIALFPLKLTRLEKLMDIRLKDLKIKKDSYKAEFEDSAIDNFGVDMTMAFFKQIKEFMHQDYFLNLLRRAKVSVNKQIRKMKGNI